MTRLFTRRRVMLDSSQGQTKPNPPVTAGVSTLPPIVRAAPVEFTRENIEKRAYYLFLARDAMRLPGSPEQDWKQAEREIHELSSR